MSHVPVSCDVQRGIATVTLDNPPVNALSDALRGRVANTSGGSYHPAKAGIFMLC